MADAAFDGSERTAEVIGSLLTAAARPASGSTILPSRERMTGRALGEDANFRRRVLAIMYQFPPSKEVGAQSCVQICRYLPSYGWDVTVLTVQERYIPDADSRTCEAFPGTVLRTRVLPDPLSIYRWLKASSKAERKRRLPIEPKEEIERGQTIGPFRQYLRSMLAVPDPYIGWIPTATVSGLAAVHKQAVECLFSSGPWWTNHLVGLALAELTGLPWIAHFRDSWAQGQWVKPVSSHSIHIEKTLERWVVKKARAVVCVTEMQTEMLQQANPDLPRSKFFTIPNGYDGAEWAAMREEITEVAHAEKDKFIITYAGNLYHGRSPYPLFRALGSLIDSGEIAREQIQVELLGHCDVAEGSRVRDVAAVYGLADCVAHTGFVNRAEALRRVARSDLLLLLVDEQNYSIPAKTYEYLRAGRPILALTSGGAVVDLLKQTGGAWVVDPADSAGITAAVRDAYRSWKSGINGRLPNQDMVASFDRRFLTGRLVEVFDKAIAGHRASSPAAGRLLDQVD